jgi:hypothetical protein
LFSVINKSAWKVYIFFRNSLLELHLITNSLYNTGSFYGKLSKPGKILLLHPNLAFCLNPENINPGSLRESFVVNQLKNKHNVELSNSADFLIDEKFTLEIGGKGKSRRQIKNITDSFIISDDMEVGYQNKIPLWLLGFLY